MCMWKRFCSDYLEAAFLEEEHIKSLDIRQCFLQKVSENKVKQKLRRTCEVIVYTYNTVCFQFVMYH